MNSKNLNAGAELFMIQTLYVFLFAYVMLSPSVYRLTNGIMPFETYDGSNPTDTGLALHAAVYVLLIFGILMVTKGSGKNKK